ncbi:MAG: MFS transporter [Alphaproteobacteria bacterium]|nr:MFS transporter [Alphaproteobacteria bacterium]
MTDRVKRAAGRPESRSAADRRPSRPGGGADRRSPKGKRRDKDEDRDVEHEAAPPPDFSMIAGGPARAAAVDLLFMTERDLTLEEALSASRAFAQLEGADRAFARAIASTTLRRRGSIDAIIGDHLDRPFPKRARRAMLILRSAAAQMLFLDTAPHAAASTAVALAQAYRETASLAGVINAICRRIAETGKSRLAALPARVDTAGWLWRSWERAYGPAGARRIADAHSKSPPPLDLTVKDPGRLIEFIERTGGVAIGAGSIRLFHEPNVPDLPGYANGDWWVQDAAAALPVKLFGDVNGLAALDMCAAPGGKTLQLAAGGARVVALDQSGPRLKRLADNLARTKLEAETLKEDARTYAPAAPFDRVLLDAPCTATGTIRRHPDVMWSKSPDSLAALAALQSKLIDRAVNLTSPGGIFVYCVCSLQPEEGEAQAAAALSRHPNLTLRPVEPGMLGDLSSAATKDGWLRTSPAMLPENGGCDGFFAAAFDVG